MEDGPFNGLVGWLPFKNADFPYKAVSNCQRVPQNDEIASCWNDGRPFFGVSPSLTTQVSMDQVSVYALRTIYLILILY